MINILQISIVCRELLVCFVNISLMKLKIIFACYGANKMDVNQAASIRLLYYHLTYVENNFCINNFLRTFSSLIITILMVVISDLAVNWHTKGSFYQTLSQKSILK